MNQTGIVTLFSPGFNLEFNLEFVCVPFPSGRVRDGVPQWEGGYGGKGPRSNSPMVRS